MKIMVIGSGVMGSGIAEQIANAGFKVYLLDIVPKNASDRNILAKQAIAKTHVINPNNIIPGNLEDNLDSLKSADWIIEVIIEKLSIKQTLYEQLEKYCSPSCIISSNTSTIPLKSLIEGRSTNFKNNFLITHFFNPPRYMPLLELITSEFTNQSTIKRILDFIDIHLGKTIIKSNDTPGFIANRIGCYWLESALSLAIDMGMSVEQVDSLISKPIGIPKTGVFGLYDLIGLDVMQLIAASLSDKLKKDDDFLNVSKLNSIISKMIEEGYTGRKGKGGFYKITKDANGNKIKEIIDLTTGEYSLAKDISSPKLELLELFNQNDYVSKLLTKTLSYAANLIPEVTDNLSDIDQVMKLGYNWKYGPFELIDMIGPNYFKQKLAEQNLPIPEILTNLKDRFFYQGNKYFSENGYKENKRPEGILFLNDYPKIVYKNNSAQIRDMGEGIASIEFTSKMAITDHDVFHSIIEFIAKYSTSFKAAIFANNQENFSAGGNLKFMLEMVETQKWLEIEQYLNLGQEAMLAIKYSKIPFISALKGKALGGGCELLLHSSAIAAHIETNSGLVEAGVGLLPGWGGCKETLLRTNTLQERISAFNNIITAKISSSAYELKEMFKLDNFEICMNVNRILENSKKLISIPKKQDKYNFVPIKLDFEPIIDKLKGYDKSIALELAPLFNLDNANENNLLAYEREIFIKLLHNKLTQERIAHMLKTGRRLAN